MARSLHSTLWKSTRGQANVDRLQNVLPKLRTEGSNSRPGFFPPRPISRRAFMKMSMTPEAFTCSHALMWILGIRDRYLSNFMIGGEQ
ncbi:UNVERIFIED_CONTAM: hypothetical protein FKN15_026582 [Acipenser sinensis]